MDLKNELSLPAGFFDLEFEKAAAKRRLENNFADIFVNRGYREFSPSLIENYELSDFSLVPKNKIFKFIDKSGDILALRWDYTTSLARFLKMNMEKISFPLKVFYCGSVFRFFEGSMGRPREIIQFGAEIIGGDVDGEIELIKGIFEFLKGTGVKGFRISVSEAEYLKRLLSAKHLPAESLEKILHAIKCKDFIMLNELASALFPEQREDLFDALLSGKNSVDFGPEMENFLEKLKNSLFDIPVDFDPSLVLDFDYYNGPMIEIYDQNKTSIGKGGRYGFLSKMLGIDKNGFGIALNLNYILGL
jgi:ATP phosphoribosyltransferase regulatory subunit